MGADPDPGWVGEGRQPASGILSPAEEEQDGRIPPANAALLLPEMDHQFVVHQDGQIHQAVAV